MAERVLTIWVIYQNPADYPERYVLRGQHVMRDSEILIDEAPTAVSANLDEVRAYVPRDLIWQPAQPDDDPSILEVWL